jgi:hypothetical protein
MVCEGDHMYEERSPINCWGCEGDHMYEYCLHKGDRMMTIHNIQEADIVEDMGRSMQRIYVSLENKKADYQSHMIEVEGKINNHPIAILIDLELAIAT